MDHRQVNEVFVTDLLAAAGRRRVTLGEVVDLGAGTAQIPIELCRRASAVRVLAIDAAESMLQIAARNVRAAGLNERIVLRRADAKKLPLADAAAACVISNSIVHHIPHPSDVLAEAVRVLAPAGLVFFRDLMRPVDEPSLCRLVDRYAAGANERQRDMFAASLAAALTLDEIRAEVAALGFEPQSVQATSDRHWTWAALKGV